MLFPPSKALVGAISRLCRGVTGQHLLRYSAECFSLDQKFIPMTGPLTETYQITFLTFQCIDLSSTRTISSTPALKSTRKVKSAWSRLKYHIKREMGIHRGNLQSFRNKEMWRQWGGLNSVFDNVIQTISVHYPL